MAALSRGCKPRIGIHFVFITKIQGDTLVTKMPAELSSIEQIFTETVWCPCVRDHRSQGKPHDTLPAYIDYILNIITSHLSLYLVILIIKLKTSHKTE